MLHAFAVVMSRFLLVDHVPLVLGKIQEAANGAKILPEGAVFWAGVFLPAKQFTEPALERRGYCELQLPVRSSWASLDFKLTAIPQATMFLGQNYSHQL